MNFFCNWTLTVKMNLLETKKKKERKKKNETSGKSFKHCRLCSAKSIFIHINSSIFNNSV